MVCNYTHCVHDNKTIDPNEQYVEINKKYYHCDCRKIMDNIKLIKAKYSDYVGADKTNFAVLSKTINNLIFDKKYDSEYILFALGRYIEERKFLRYPAGLYHIVDNPLYLTAWNERKSKNLRNLNIVDSPKQCFRINKNYDSFDEDSFFE